MQKEFSFVTRHDGRLSQFGQYEGLTLDEISYEMATRKSEMSEEEAASIADKLGVGGVYYIFNGDYMSQYIERTK
jgi:hypothetical protein